MIVFIYYINNGGIKMTKKVIVPKEFEKYLRPSLEAKGFEVISLVSENESAILEHKDASGIVINTSPLSKEILDQMPNLKIISRFGVGYNNVDLDYTNERGTYVTNTPAGNEVSVAENAVTDMLLISKDLYNVSKHMRNGDNEYAFDNPSRDLRGKTVGIIGYGNIGKYVAKLLSRFGVNILIWNRTEKESQYGTFVEWDDLLKQSDFVSLHLPAVKGTIGSINKESFKMMKNSAYIINFARGAVINQADLVSALKDGEIAGAGLDVYETEPLPMDSELRKLDNVFLTPHSASNSIESFTKIANMDVSEINKVLNGEKPDHCVNGL
ncbi:3-phosphoglycerate dehydrogenase [Apilactobacillus timberlakei]|uniref:3-phosphoglycerate dehydrogenase n=2 Tax=Apilactobacillus timberlakei TaxID=2008380 RepID=A0ABY2YUI6_9LACO|nr:3-phosphoglycerate dehydrogenase [Apilactobacillus timberlakei]TPR15714.1 3-phosphoglycerate dehydrogenase [Apilactobacillus timberlakei]TPR16075.1 3-phosphoglycerate dehydrogenase [Apilactobacillus timberlakei]